MVLLGHGRVVCQEHAFEVDVLPSRVVELNPVISPAVFVGCDGVVGTHFVDYDR